jgi:hypothetical protein
VTTDAPPSTPRRARSAWRDLVALLWSLALLGYLLVPGSLDAVAGLPVPVLAVIAVAVVVGARHVIVKGIAYARVITRARRNRLDLVKHLARRPAIGIADATYEVAAFVSSSLHHRYKYLASAKVSSRIGCPF